MIKLGNKELENRYITDSNGVPRKVAAAYVGNNLVYNAKIEEANAEFYKRKTGGTQSVASGIAAIKEIRGKSIVWNQQNNFNVQYPEGMLYDIDNTEGASSQNIYIFNYGKNVPIDHICYERIVIINDYEAGQTPFFYWNVHRFQNNKGTNIPLGVYVHSIIGQSKEIPNANAQFYIQTQPGKRYKFLLKSMELIDLTLMFGAGNEPATVEEFEKMFPLDYYDYNEGEIIPFAGQNLVTTGFNQWDEEWEKGVLNTNNGSPIASSTQIRAKNMIPVLPNTSYYCTANNIAGGDGIWTAFFDIDGNIITSGITTTAIKVDNVWDIHNKAFTTNSQTAFIRFYISGPSGTTYNNDICINISNPDRNGTYEPYENHTLSLDPSQWRDTNNNLVFPYGGMHGVGNVCDYAIVDADGYIRKAVRVFGQVDIGSLDWNYDSQNEKFSVLWGQNLRKIPGLAITPRYIYEATINLQDKQFFLGRPSNYTNWFYIKDSAYTTEAAFKTAMAGVPLIYELYTPVEVELATPIYAKYLVDKDGTEEITPANGTAPYTTMANLHLSYFKR